MNTIVCIHSLTAHGTVGLKPFVALLGEAVLPVPSVLLTGPGNMPGCRRFPCDLAAMLDGTLAAVATRGSRAVLFVGYLADAAQVAAVEAALDQHAAVISALVVDPVSGDDGRAYVAPALIAAWPRLLARADWALPNMTEVALLAGTPGDAGIEALRAAHPQLNLVVTGVTADGEVATRLVTADGARAEHRQPRIAGHVSGTGDLFAAAWVREVFVRGLAPAEALGRAAQAVAAALREGRGELALDAARG